MSFPKKDFDLFYFEPFLNGSINKLAKTAVVEDMKPDKPLSRSSQFRYYIHDSTNCFRFQLIGELSQLDAPELIGCWFTARTLLGSRKLVIDVRMLKAIDDIGRQWLDAMITDGAEFIPARLVQNALRRDSRGFVLL